MGLTNVFVACVNGVTNITCDMGCTVFVLNWPWLWLAVQPSRITHVLVQITFTFDEKRSSRPRGLSFVSSDPFLLPLGGRV